MGRTGTPMPWKGGDVPVLRSRERNPELVKGIAHVSLCSYLPMSSSRTPSIFRMLRTSSSESVFPPATYPSSPCQTQYFSPGRAAWPHRSSRWVLPSHCPTGELPSGLPRDEGLIVVVVVVIIREVVAVVLRERPLPHEPIQPAVSLVVLTPTVHRTVAEPGATTWALRRLEQHTSSRTLRSIRCRYAWDAPDSHAVGCIAERRQSHRTTATYRDPLAAG